MKTNELKHIAPYLPYRLKGTYILSDVIKIGDSQKDETRIVELTDDNVKFFTSYCKPIHRPLTDLIKPCLEGGLIPALELVKLIISRGLEKDIAPTIDFTVKIVNKPFGKMLKVTKCDKWYLLLSFDEVDRLKHFLIEKLAEWHFDIFGLIEQGLAIDINILNNDK